MGNGIPGTSIIGPFGHWAGQLAFALLLASSGAAQAEPVFLPDATLACTREAERLAPNLSGHAVLDCVGRSAQACMTTDGGETTIGMIDCLDAELKLWDGRLNAAYAAKMDAARTSDAEMASIGASVPSLENSLREMQRAWMAFRDAACLYEQAQWMGGTGGGPATMACHMQETARQALRLEGWWAQ
ncbi:lysozyme inhibitor LprI family protein [Roseovarius mucosus]|uniref:lysozyme inhibitor LprI family protein n=1 Tax=Roseovarius mucosus TaxID=215743 RepID=UPI003F73042B